MNLELDSTLYNFLCLKAGQAARIIGDEKVLINAQQKNNTKDK